MKTTLWALAVVLAAGLLMAELVMDVTPPERRQLYLVFGLMAVSTFVAAVVAVRLATRLASLRASLVIVSLAAVGVTGAAVAAAAMTMFIESHDLTLVMVALLLGVGLGGVVASGVARPLASDLAAISIAADRVGDGDLTARSGVHRTDELGAAAAALDAMIEKLELAEEERRVLLSAVGHDLRTPLGSMRERRNRSSTRCLRCSRSLERPRR